MMFVWFYNLQMFAARHKAPTQNRTKFKRSFMAEKEAQCKAFTRLFYCAEKPVPLGGHLHLVQRLAVVVWLKEFCNL